MEPAVTIMTRLYSYNLFSKAQNKLLLWTNEIAGSSAEDAVFLTNKKGDSPLMEWKGFYPEFKQYVKQNY